MTPIQTKEVQEALNQNNIETTSISASAQRVMKQAEVEYETDCKRELDLMSQHTLVIENLATPDELVQVYYFMIFLTLYWLLLLLFFF